MNCFLFTNPPIHQSSNPPNSVRDSLWCFDTHRLRCFHNQNGNCAVGDVQASVFAAPACANLQVSLLTAACWKDSSIHYTNIQKQCIDCIDICMYMMRTDTSSFTCIVCIVVHMDLDIYYIIRHIRISLYIYHIYLYHIYIYMWPNREDFLVTAPRSLRRAPIPTIRELPSSWSPPSFGQSPRPELGDMSTCPHKICTFRSKVTSGDIRCIYVWIKKTKKNKRHQEAWILNSWKMIPTWVPDNCLISPQATPQITERYFRIPFVTDPDSRVFFLVKARVQEVDTEREAGNGKMERWL